MRIALIDRPGLADRPDVGNRFAVLGQRLDRAGHEVLVLEGVPAGLARTPILTGLNRAGAAAPMIEAHALAHHLADLRPDLVVAPLRGGLLHGVLMARACGEAFATTRVAVWCDTPSRTRFLYEEDLSSGLAPLIADALERHVITLADAMIVPNSGFPALHGWKRCGAFLPAGELPTSPEAGSASLPLGDVEEIVFVGPLRRHRGVVEFISVMEHLAHTGLLEGRTVTFLGAARPSALGIGRDWLGFRAATWNFPFKVVESADAAEQQRYLGGAGRLAIAIAHDADELLEIRRCNGYHIGLLWGRDGPRQLADRLDQAMREVLSGRPISTTSPETDWPTLIDKVMALPLTSDRSQPSPVQGVTVCVLHCNRLGYLTEALASIPNWIEGRPVEVLVIDNASRIPSVEDEIRKIAGPRDLLRIIRFAEPVSQAFALNRGAREARHEILIFLDDDNAFAATGVERLAQAVAHGHFDIVVTALEIFDEGAPLGTTPGRLIFLGAAHTAGLFFNGFGDTAMAVRRDAFLGLGGFHDPGYSYSPLDWVTLAKAQSAGLRIGSLQWPAVRYRRNTTKADLEANKIDQEGARWFVFQAYSGLIDAELVARYAQKLQLEEL